MARAFPINSSVDAVTVPGVNDYDLNRVPTEFLEEGVVRGFAVSQRGAGANMSVDVAAGLALIEITNTNVAHGRTDKTWFEETVTTNVSVTTADPTNPRKDRVVLRIDVSTDPDVSASNIAVIENIAGTPAGSPSAPAEPSNAITLAIIDIPASDTTISTGQITDSRTYVTMDTAVLADVIRAANLVSTTSGKGASLVGVEDVGTYFAGTNVETILQEVGAALAGIAVPTVTALFVATADSAEIGGSTTSKVYFATNLVTLTAAQLAAGTAFEFTAGVSLDMHNGGPTNCTLAVNLGTTAVASFVFQNAGGGVTTHNIVVHGILTVRTDSATGAIHVAASAIDDQANNSTNDFRTSVARGAAGTTAATTTAVDTTADQDFRLSVTFDTNSGNNRARLVDLVVKEINP